MNVRDLIATLSRLNPNLEVYLASDEEGNSKNPVYVAQTHLMNNFEETVHPDDAEEYDDGELHEVVVLWP